MSTNVRWRASHAGCVYAQRKPKPKPVIDTDELLKRLIDEEYTRPPFYRSRKMVVHLGRCGHWVGSTSHLVCGFKVSSDLKFIEKHENIVGPYMSPPENASYLT